MVIASLQLISVWNTRARKCIWKRANNQPTNKQTNRNTQKKGTEIAEFLKRVVRITQLLPNVWAGEHRWTLKNHTNAMKAAWIKQWMKIQTPVTSPQSKCYPNGFSCICVICNENTFHCCWFLYHSLSLSFSLWLSFVWLLFVSVLSRYFTLPSLVLSFAFIASTFDLYSYRYSHSSISSPLKSDSLHFFYSLVSMFFHRFLYSSR